MAPMRSWVAGLALLTAVPLGGCSSEKGFETREVTWEEFGAPWPFVAETGVLACEPGGVPTFTVAGTTVGLSDPDFTEFNHSVWSEDATEESAIRLGDEALALCD